MIIYNIIPLGKYYLFLYNIFQDRVLVEKQ